MPSSTPAAPARRFSLADQAAALEIVLTKEFGTTFAFYDASNGSRICTRDGGATQNHADGLDPSAAIRFGSSEHADARLKENGRFQLILVIHEHGIPALVAAGELPALTRDVTDLAQEQLRMRSWAQAVSDRLRLADSLVSRHRDEGANETHTKPAWDALLRLDHLARRLRIHKEPGRNQRRIIRAAWEILGAEALVWVPKHADEAVLSEGVSALTEWDARQLAARISHAPEVQSSGLVLWNQVQASSWGGRFPRIQNILAMPINEHASNGWLIAINKQEVHAAPSLNGIIPFRRSDAALLTPFAALLDLHVRSSGRYRELQDLLVGLAQALTAAIDAKDSYTYGHSERVARIAVALGRQLDLQEEELSDLFLTGLLHDIGKIGIRDEVLRKRGELTREEFEHVKQHVTIGYSILQNLRPIAQLLPGIRNHHERYDGKGYPDGLAGEAIPLMARILAVADAYDAMTTSRPYRSALSVPRVEQILADGAGSQWDRRVVDAFMKCRQKIHGIRQRGVGDSLRVVLTDVLRSNSSSLLHVSAPAQVETE
jgi:HD-GYP domain-containing protein (c-di-GMP phosphodiesterase class II)